MKKRKGKEFTSYEMGMLSLCDRVSDFTKRAHMQDIVRVMSIENRGAYVLKNNPQ